MKQQIVFLEGGNAKENYNSYYEYLESLEYDLYNEKLKNYKHQLRENLGDGYEVFYAPFPNRAYADYEAWKIMFEKMILFLKDDIIFVATSLGGTFISKYVSENILDIKIGKIIMLAPAFYDTPGEVLGSFLSDTSKFQNINSQCENIFIYHSTDDECVPFSDSEEYLKLFPNVVFRKFTDKGHFYLEERIIELEEDIKK